VLHKHPELSSTIAAYIQRYHNIPRNFSKELIAYIRSTELYHSVNGELLRACIERLSVVDSAVLGNFSADRLLRPRRGSIQLQASYKESLIAFALGSKSIDFVEYDRLAFSELDWWVRKCALRAVDAALFGTATYEDLLNRCLRTEGEVSCVAAARLLQDGVKLFKPYGDVAGIGKRTLKAAGRIRSVGQPASLLNGVLAYILARPQTPYDWKRFFGRNHRHAELMMIFLKRNRESNIDAFLVQLDSFCDFLTAELYRRLKPGKGYPAYGHAVKDAVLGAKLPQMMRVLKRLHEVRLESATAHPKTKSTGKPTRRLKHRDFYRLRRDLILAFDEFEATISP
jgi:hypothetical protein